MQPGQRGQSLARGIAGRAAKAWPVVLLLFLALLLAGCAKDDILGAQPLPEQSPWGLKGRAKPARPEAAQAKEAETAPALEKRASQLRVAQDMQSWAPADLGPERRRPSADTASDPRRVINFRDAPLSEVVGVFSELLGINVVLPAEAKGTVTVQSGGEVRADEVMPLFETVLEVNGWALVNETGVYRLTPLAQAKTGAALPRVGRKGLARGGQEGFGVEVFYLNYLTASQAVTSLKRFTSSTGEMAAVAGANALVVAESEANLTKLRRLVELLDVPVSRRVGIRVYHVEHVPVANLARDLRKIFEAMGISQSPSSGVWVDIVALPDLDSIAVISSVRDMFGRVEQWLADLDSQISEAEVGVFVYHCQSGDAQAIANVLGGLFGLPGQTKKQTTAQDPRSTALSASGLPADLKAQAQPVTSSPSQTSAGSVTGTSAAFTREAAGSDRRRGETPLLARGQVAASGEKEEQQATVLEGGIRVVVEQNTNSLVIRAPRRQYESLLRAIRKLDVFPRQVLIEVLIAEVSLDDSMQMGVDWSIATSTGGDTTLTNTLTSDTTLTPTSGLVYTIARADAVKVTLKALATKNKANVISAPLLLAAENQESRITVGQEIPIITSVTVSESLDTTTGTKISDRSVKYRDIGINLAVIPRINDSGLVKLQISQEISEVSSESFGSTSSPSFNKRSATTNVITTDSQSVVIAGLIKTEFSDKDSGIPYLSDIPGLGNLFKVASKTKARTELIITLTPYVIHDMADAKQIIQDLKDELKRIRHGNGLTLPERGGIRIQGNVVN